MDILEPHEHYTIYVLRDCPFSIKSLKMLENSKKNYKVIYVEEEMSRDKFKSIYGQSATFPRIYLNDKFIGGSAELEKLL